jgi:hypothetical protein
MPISARGVKGASNASFGFNLNDYAGLGPGNRVYLNQKWLRSTGGSIRSPVEQASLNRSRQKTWFGYGKFCVYLFASPRLGKWLANSALFNA